MSSIRINICEEEKEKRKIIQANLRRSKREECLSKRRFRISMEEETVVIPPPKTNGQELMEEDITSSCIKNPFSHFNDLIGELERSVKSGDFEQQYEVLTKLKLFLGDDSNASSSLLDICYLLNQLMTFVYCPHPGIVITSFEIMILVTSITGKYVNTLLQLGIFNVCAQKIKTDNNVFVHTWRWRGGLCSIANTNHKLL